MLGGGGGRRGNVGDVTSMVALRAQALHSRLPPKGCVVSVRVAMKQAHSVDLQESVNPDRRIIVSQCWKYRVFAGGVGWGRVGSGPRSPPPQ